MRRMPRHTLWISIAGVAVVTAYAVLAAVQILVLNPLAAAPGMSLAEIRAAMAAVDEDPGDIRALVILGIGVVLAVGVAAVSLLTLAPPIVPGLSMLALLMFGPFAYFVASFSAGMALADTFGISGADRSPWALPLVGVSAVAAVLVLVIGGAVVIRGRRVPAA